MTTKSEDLVPMLWKILCDQSTRRAMELGVVAEHVHHTVLLTEVATQILQMPDEQRGVAALPGHFPVLCGAI